MRLKNRKLWVALIVATVATVAVRLTVFGPDYNLLVVGITFLVAFLAAYVAVWLATLLVRLLS